MLSTLSMFRVSQHNHHDCVYTYYYLFTAKLLASQFPSLDCEQLQSSDLVLFISISPVLRTMPYTKEDHTIETHSFTQLFIHQVISSYWAFTLCQTQARLWGIR